MQEIRVKEGWSYGANCSMNQALGKHSLQLTMAPAAEVCPVAIARMLELYADLHDTGLSQDEFDFTRSYLQGSAAFERATANQRLYRTMQEEIYGLPKHFGDGFADRLTDMTVAEVNVAIAQHTKPRDLAVVVVATASSMLPELEGLGWDSIEVVAYDSY